VSPFQWLEASHSTASVSPAPPGRLRLRHRPKRRPRAAPVCRRQSKGPL